MQHQPSPSPDEVSTIIASAWFLSVRGEGVLAVHRLPAIGHVVLGRGRDATLAIRHVSLSRRHARLRLGRTPTIEDLGSRHGTLVSGRRLPPGEVRIVRPGEVIQLGAVSVVLEKRDEDFKHGQHAG